jgi:hypothetical protein
VVLDHLFSRLCGVLALQGIGIAIAGVGSIIEVDK